MADVTERPNTEGADSDAARSLSVEIVQKHLGVLGKNPFTIAFVYTTATLCGLHLTALDAIGEFRNLQHVVCSTNLLRSLVPLRNLRHLLSVDASHNQLTQALDYDVPICTPEHAWVDGGEWIGSLLRRADLSYNCITSIRTLSTSHPFLQELNLAHNGIREVRGISALRFLRVLDLSHNRLVSTKGLVPPGFFEMSDQQRDETPHLEALEVLRLSHNHMTSIDEVVGLPRLLELDVAHNKLTTVGCLEHCYRLQKLNASHNELRSVNDINCLLPLPFLQTLELVGCPFVAQEPSQVFYRARVLRRLQQLAELDGEDVTAKEKIKALAMHGSEIASRKDVLAKFLPSEDFVNFLPPLDFDEDMELVQFYEARFGSDQDGPENSGDGAEE